MWLKVFLFSCYIIYSPPPPQSAGFTRQWSINMREWFFLKLTVTEWLWCCFWSKVPYFSKWSLIVKPIDYTETMTTWCIVCLCLWGPERNYYIKTFIWSCSFLLLFLYENLISVDSGSRLYWLFLFKQQTRLKDSLSRCFITDWVQRQRHDWRGLGVRLFCSLLACRTWRSEVARSSVIALSYWKFAEVCCQS